MNYFNENISLSEIQVFVYCEYILNPLVKKIPIIEHLLKTRTFNVMNVKPTGYLPLNLVSPPEHAFRKINGDWHVYDIIRRKWLALTPEEWVRQHLVAEFLSKGYPPTTLSLEKSILINGLLRRFDLMVFGSIGTMMLVECKKHNVELNEKVQIQALCYNKTIKSPTILITNGALHLFYVFKKNEYQLRTRQIPDFIQLKNIINQL